MDSFDDLFNEFFNNEKPKRGRRKKIDDEPKIDSIEKLISSLSKATEITNSDEQFDIENNYGEPDDIEYFEDDDLFFKRSTWKKDGMDIVKLEVSDSPFDEEQTKKENKSLEELLQEALESENYEKAAEIRDEINKNKKN